MTLCCQTVSSIGLFRKKICLRREQYLCVQNVNVLITLAQDQTLPKRMLTDTSTCLGGRGHVNKHSSTRIRQFWNQPVRSQSKNYFKLQHTANRLAAETQREYLLLTKLQNMIMGDQSLVRLGYLPLLRRVTNNLTGHKPLEFKFMEIKIGMRVLHNPGSCLQKITLAY